MDEADPGEIERAQQRLREKTGRSCGGCTACCRPFRIEALKKPANQWCQHCKVGTGCKVYETRPMACRGFACLWLYGFGDREDRPDLVEVVWDTYELVPGEVYIVRLVEVIPGGYARLMERDKGIIARLPGVVVDWLQGRGITVVQELLLVGAKKSVIVTPKLRPHQQAKLEAYMDGG